MLKFLATKQLYPEDFQNLKQGDYIYFILRNSMVSRLLYGELKNNDGEELYIKTQSSFYYVHSKVDWVSKSKNKSKLAKIYYESYLLNEQIKYANQRLEFIAQEEEEIKREILIEKLAGIEDDYD